jgi:GxxExxY protein
MNTDAQPVSSFILIERETTEKILGTSFKVLNTLGAGFLEKVYENALSMNFGGTDFQLRIKRHTT